MFYYSDINYIAPLN